MTSPVLTNEQTLERLALQIQNSLRAGSLVWVGYRGQRRQRQRGCGSSTFARDTLYTECKYGGPLGRRPGRVA